jgi:hypothetical protein
LLLLVNGGGGGGRDCQVFSPNPFCIGGMAKELPPVPEHFLEAEICDKEKEGHTSLAKLLRKVSMVATMIKMVVVTKED